MNSVNGLAWDLEWEPLDVIRKTSPDQLVEPLAFRAGGCCEDCGSKRIRGLTIRLVSEIFHPDVDYLDRVKVFAIMTCATWHDFLVPTQYPEEMSHWMEDIIRWNGDSGYSKGDVCDALSDRWSRFMPEITRFAFARVAFHDAIRLRLEYITEWPAENVQLLIPGDEENGTIAGYKGWKPYAGAP